MSEQKIYYKGLDADFKCRGYAFEVGHTYRHDGEVKACSSGFHSCANPWDVLSYYDITSRFALVEVGGETVTHEDDSKIASAEITIKAELKLPDFVKSCIDWLKDACKSDISPAPGDYSQLAASGDSSQLAASGDYSQLAASGYYSQLAASGDSSKLAASGDYSKLAASGDYSRLAASGDYSIAMSAGIIGKVKGGKNCALALTRWVESEKRYRITIAYVGEDGIKEGTWYSLDKDGKFIEVNE